MNIAGIDYESVNDGEGVRTVIYVSGCSHNCYNCHNPETHDINYGVPFTEELQNEIIENIKKRPFISGITWSGGDPLHENNLDDVLKFTNRIRLLLSEKTIWLYSGWTWEQLFTLKAINGLTLDTIKANGDVVFKNDKLSQNLHKRREIITKCNVLVDGQYIDSQKDMTLKFRGSKNQRLIDVKKSLEQNKIMLWCN